MLYDLPIDRQFKPLSGSTFRSIVTCIHREIWYKTYATVCFKKTHIFRKFQLWQSKQIPFRLVVMLYDIPIDRQFQPLSGSTFRSIVTSIHREISYKTYATVCFKKTHIFRKFQLWQSKQIPFRLVVMLCDIPIDRQFQPL